MSNNSKIGVAILGSTGSIGTQTLDVISQHRDMYNVELLTANDNSDLLIMQAIKYEANSVVICNPNKYKAVEKALAPYHIKVFCGIDSICDLMSSENISIVVTAMVGFSGLRPTIAAIKAKKRIAIANKETLVAGGVIISKLSQEYGSPLIPVDSEHSAIFQALQGEYSPIERILLTASGGPFLKSGMEEIKQATKVEALNHPRWKMGSKVTIDSASMMNKGLEMIEAKWLFNLDPNQIEIIIHPESIIHSMVEFNDGSIIAQLSEPDMRIPIQYALTYPIRPKLNTKRINFKELGSLSFIAPDENKFPAIKIAYEAIRKGGNIPCIMNAANEVAVEAFLNDKIMFYQIPSIIEKTITQVSFIENPSLDDIYLSNEDAIIIARGLVS